MAKKELNDDLLAGGSVSTGKDKSAKKAEKLAMKAEKNAEKAKKLREKNEAKRTELKSQIDALKASKAEETDEKKIEQLDKKIKALSAKYAAVGSSDKLSVAPKTAKIIKSVVCIVLVVALLVTYVATGAVRKGFISKMGLPAQYFTGLVVDNGEGSKAKIKVSTYNFYFAVTYNSLRSTQEQYKQYGMDISQYDTLNVDFDKPFSKQTLKDPDDEKKTITWAEYMHRQVLDSIENTYTYYLEAVKANDGKDPEITDEQKTELQDTLKEYREAAHKYGYTLSGYLVQAMGKGVTESVFTTESTRQYIAQNYQEQLNKDITEKKYTDKDYDKYKKEHADDLKSVDIKIFECESEDKAKAFAKALKADGSNFADLASKNATSDNDKAAYKNDEYSTHLNVTKSMLQNDSAGYAIATAEHDHEDGEEHSEDEVLKYPGLDWIFSADRKAGDIKQYSTSVVYVISPAKISDRKTVNVRHILINPIADSKDADTQKTAAQSATAEQWSKAYKEAKNILDEWKSGKATEDSFAKLAEKKTDDTGSASNGGLYEDVAPGKMVNAFSTWCFDSSRKTGDTGIVRTEYGYHIMYFVKNTSTPVWKFNAQEALSADDSKNTVKKLEDSYKIKEKWLGSRYFEKDIDIDN